MAYDYFKIAFYVLMCAPVIVIGFYLCISIGRDILRIKNNETKSFIENEQKKTIEAERRKNFDKQYEQYRGQK